MKTTIAKQIIIFLMLLFLMSCATPMTQEQAKEIYSRHTVGHFLETMEVKDGPLDIVATFSTVRGFEERKGLLNILNDDIFMKAEVDKKTGRTTYLIYGWVTYVSQTFRNYNSVNYEALGGPKSATLERIGHNVTACSRGGCQYTEHFGFYIDEAFLREGIKRYWENLEEMKAWRIKFGAKAFHDWTTLIMAAEIVAIVDAVDNYKLVNALGPRE